MCGRDVMADYIGVRVVLSCPITSYFLCCNAKSCMGNVFQHHDTIRAIIDQPPYRTTAVTAHRRSQTRTKTPVLLTNVNHRIYMRSLCAIVFCRGHAPHMIDRVKSWTCIRQLDLVFRQSHPVACDTRHVARHWAN